MSEQDLDKMEEGAKAATQGEWAKDVLCSSFIFEPLSSNGILPSFDSFDSFNLLSFLLLHLRFPFYVDLVSPQFRHGFSSYQLFE